MAAHRHAMAAMALISFAESSFFPLPPDFLLVPMTLARPRRAWLIAAVYTVTSVEVNVCSRSREYIQYHSTWFLNYQSDPFKDKYY